MRLVQTIAFVMGLTVLGTVAGFLGAVFLIAALQRPVGEPWQRGMGQLYGGLFCGLPLGSLAGLLVGLSCLRTHFENGPWSLAIWLGVLAGASAGTAVGFQWTLTREYGWIGIGLLAVACATAGGLLASAIARFATASRGPR